MFKSTCDTTELSFCSLGTPVPVPSADGSEPRAQVVVPEKLRRIVKAFCNQGSFNRRAT
jgi:hypothetical protein